MRTSSTSRWFGTSVRRAAGVALAALLSGALAACGGTPSRPAASPSATTPAASSAPAPSSPTATSSPTAAAPTAGKPASSPSTQEPVGDRVEIDVTIENGKVEPNGKKVDVPLGATVVLDVISDEDDEIHAHIGGEDGYSLEVKAGVPATGRFTMNSPGSFEVESHHLEKIIVILNVR